MFAHEDFCGHKGTIGPGDLQVGWSAGVVATNSRLAPQVIVVRACLLQWMTAGRGIMHAEMPHNKEVSHGLQLWVNLAAKDKMCEPAYQELKGKDIPQAKRDGVTATVIAGEALGVKSPVYTRTPTW